MICESFPRIILDTMGPKYGNLFIEKFVSMNTTTMTITGRQTLIRLSLECILLFLLKLSEEFKRRLMREVISQTKKYGETREQNLIVDLAKVVNNLWRWTISIFPTCFYFRQLRR